MSLQANIHIFPELQKIGYYTETVLIRVTRWRGYLGVKLISITIHSDPVEPSISEIGRFKTERVWTRLLVQPVPDLQTAWETINKLLEWAMMSYVCWLLHLDHSQIFTSHTWHFSGIICICEEACLKMSVRVIHYQGACREYLHQPAYSSLLMLSSHSQALLLTLLLSVSLSLPDSQIHVCCKGFIKASHGHLKRWWFTPLCQSIKNWEEWKEENE